MDLFFRLFIYFTFNVSLLFSLTKEFNIHQENISSSRSVLSNNVTIFMASKQKMSTNSDEIIIFEEDFENGENGWSLDAGWELIDTSANSVSASGYYAVHDVVVGLKTGSMSDFTYLKKVFDDFLLDANLVRYKKNFWGSILNRKLSEITLTDLEDIGLLQFHQKRFINILI